MESAGPVHNVTHEGDEVASWMVAHGFGAWVSAVQALGVLNLVDMPLLTEADLTGVGVPVIQARKLVMHIRKAPFSSSSSGSSSNEDVKADAAPADGLYDTFDGDRAGGAKVHTIPGVKVITAADLRILAPLGSGSCGVVYQAEWRGSVVAVKQVLRALSHGGLSEAAEKELQAMVAAGNHPHVVPLLGVTGVLGGLSIVTDFCANGTVLDVLRTGPSLPVVLRMAADAAAGVSHLHAEGIVHRDLACRNLLVDVEMRVRVADFGLARITQQDTFTGTEGLSGPIRWMAPETFSRQFSKMSDVYSFGVCLFEMVARGAEPWEGLENFEVASKVTAGCTLEQFLEASVHPSVRALMVECWQYDPTARPTMTDIARRLAALAIHVSAESSSGGAAGAGVETAVATAVGVSTEQPPTSASSLSSADSPAATHPVVVVYGTIQDAQEALENRDAGDTSTIIKHLHNVSEALLAAAPMVQFRDVNLHESQAAEAMLGAIQYCTHVNLFSITATPEQLSACLSAIPACVSLRVRDCDGFVDDVAVAFLAAHSGSLAELDVSKVAVGVATFRSLASCPNLRTLSVTDVDTFTPECADVVHQLPITRLHVGGCKGLSTYPHTLINMHQLRHLSFSELAHVDGLALGNQIMTVFQMLESLDISSTQIPSDSLNNLTQVAKAIGRSPRGPGVRLQALDVSWCSSLTSRDITAFVTECTALKELRVRQTDVTDADVATMCSHAKRLRILDVRRCTAVTAAGIVQAVMDHCPYLEELWLDWCLGPVMPQLTRLITELPCSRLSILSLQGVKTVDKSLIDLLRTSRLAPTLKRLDVSWVNAFDTHDADILASLCRQAVVVDYYGQSHTNRLKTA